jgi:hypothetical protein
VPWRSQPVRVAALDDIIASKEFANRPKDHDALLELYQLQRALNDPTPAPAPAWPDPEPQ